MRPQINSRHIFLLFPVRVLHSAVIERHDRTLIKRQVQRKESALKDKDSVHGEVESSGMERAITD